MPDMQILPVLWYYTFIIPGGLNFSNMELPLGIHCCMTSLFLACLSGMICYKVIFVLHEFFNCNIFFFFCYNILSHNCFKFLQFLLNHCFWCCSNYPSLSTSTALLLALLQICMCITPLLLYMSWRGQYHISFFLLTISSLYCSTFASAVTTLPALDVLQHYYILSLTILCFSFFLHFFLVQCHFRGFFLHDYPLSALHYYSLWRCYNYAGLRAVHG